ncbi:MAG: M48 family metallopeptidase [Bacteroidota bacterium]
MIVNNAFTGSFFCSVINGRNLRYVWLYLSFICIHSLSAQESFQRIKAEGIIPQDFLFSSTEKYLKQIQELSEDKAKVRNAKKQFYQGSYYYINELLLSGKILFNDPVSKYLADILDVLLENQQGIREQLSIYAVKSPSVNAFTSIDGKIFVNLGLLSHLQNEAQLAYVLSHEISHFTQAHALDIFLQQKGISAKPDEPLKQRKLDNILEINHYSQEKEQEADLEGLNLFINSAYEVEAAVEVFDILKRAEAPFAQIPYDRNFLERKSLKFPDSYYLSPDSLLPEKDSLDQSGFFFGTHPRPEERKQIIQKTLEKQSFGNRKLWILGKKRFEEIQKLARFEACFLFLQQQRYERAIYCAYSLLQLYPNEAYLERIVVQALYGLAKYASVGRLWDVHVDHEEIEGESRQINHMFNKMPDQELCILATLHSWELRKAYPSDQSLVLMSEDLMKDLGQFFVDSISWFQILEKDTEITEENYLRYAFSDYMKEGAFRKELRENLRIGKARNQIQRKKRSKNNKGKELKGFNLNLDEVIFVNPSFQRIDERKEKVVRFLSSEKAELTYLDLLQKHSKKLGLKNTMLSKHELEADDVAVFNDLSLLNDWVEEKNRYDDLSLVSINHNAIQEVFEKYGIKYFVWTGGISIAQKRKDKTLFLGGGILFPPALPYSLYYNFSPQHDTFFYTLVYDIQSGEALLKFPKWIKMKDEFDVLNSISYDLIFQISQHKKSK